MNSLRRAGGAAAAPGLAVRIAAALGLAATILLAGCHNFFLCQKASCPSNGNGSGGTGSTSGDYAYVSNSSSGSTSISEYDVSAGSLTAIAGSPYNLQYQPVAMNVSPNDEFLYVASLPSVANAGIYLYTINSSTGAISGPSGGGVLIGAALSSMDVSPDGNFLFALSSSGALLTEYQTNTSTGALALVSSFQVPGLTCGLAGGNTLPISQTCTVKVAPSGQYVLVSLGTAGTVIFPYTSSGGITTPNYKTIPAASPTSGDYSVALDGTNRVYIARTTALAVWQINDSQGDAAQLSTTAYNSGVTPRSVALSNKGDFVYTANEGDGTISAWSIGTTGGLTAVTGSPFTGPTSVSALGADKSGSYLVAAGYNSSSGVQLFSIGSTGALTVAASAGTGTSTTYPVVLAMSH